MKTVTIDVLCANKFTNSFMRACDVFENGKCYAEYLQLNISGTPDLKKIVQNVKNSLEATGKDVVFVAIRSVNGKRHGSSRAYFRPQTQTISNGTKFGLFADLLKQLEYQVKTDKNMNVIAVN